MPAELVSDLVGRVQEEVSADAGRNRFVDALEAGRVPRERLTWLAGEQFRIVGSDQRSFALLAARFPQPPAGEMFLSLAQGELQALRLLSDFAAALGYRISGGEAAVIAPGTFAMDPVTHLTPGHYFSSPGLWIGFALTAAFLAAAVRLRRYREPI